MQKLKIYLAGQSNEHDNNWKEIFKNIPECDFHDWEIHSDQTSPDTYFPDDLRGVKSAHFMVANPGVAPSEATWIEIGYFYANNTKKPGDFCESLIIIWKEDRNPKWSIDFVKKTGHIVSTAQEAKNKLILLLNNHVRIINDTEICPICRRAYSEKNPKVKYHLQYNPPKLIYACSSCNYAENLSRHWSRHLSPWQWYKIRLVRKFARDYRHMIK